MAKPLDIDALQIVLYPDPVLRQVCPPVERFDDELRRLAGKMLELMHQPRGVGLAGPQVGVTRRLFVCNPTGQPDDDLVCINPELSGLTRAAEFEEGCLSLPDVLVPIRRAEQVHLRAFDLDGRPFERDAQDLIGRVWQHETDHLDGRLILDYMSEASQIANRRLLKQLRADYEAGNKSGKKSA
ncbi:MAG: peptide deformylase [Planctomycetes bacterium]|nr:peptide deformylase [Planctomycetota bacterium]